MGKWICILNQNCVAIVVQKLYNLLKEGIMAKTSNINIRISPEKKKEAEQLFSTFGITVTDAINIFLSMSILEGGFPFEIKQPKYNYETEQAIKEARDIISGKIEAKSYSSLDELLKDLESDD